MYHSFLIYSFTDGHLGCFQYMAIVNCAAMNIGVHKFFWIGVSILAVELLGQKAVLFLVFSGNSILFSIVVVPVCNPTNSALEFPFPHKLSNNCCRFIYVGHSNRHEVVSHCGFNLHICGSWQY